MTFLYCSCLSYQTNICTLNSYFTNVYLTHLNRQVPSLCRAVRAQEARILDCCLVLYNLARERKRLLESSSRASNVKGYRISQSRNVTINVRINVCVPFYFSGLSYSTNKRTVNSYFTNVYFSNEVPSLFQAEVLPKRDLYDIIKTA